MATGLETGFLLDWQWFWMTAGIERTKKPDLLLLLRVLAEARLPYALIGGLAIQVHQAEPRTTLDIDIALTDRRRLPREALAAAGFRETGHFTHSDNWVGPGGTPVQFTDDPALATAVAAADQLEVDGIPLRVLRRVDLLREKLRAAADPARRRSKRLQDLGDAQALLEADPTLARELTELEHAILERLP